MPISKTEKTILSQAGKVLETKIYYRNRHRNRLESKNSAKRLGFCLRWFF